jgi:hypothetical protein
VCIERRGIGTLFGMMIGILGLRIAVENALVADDEKDSLIMIRVRDIR